MTGDERDRILGLLDAGPATVARLVDGLGLPGGVVSYELKLLERDGLVRVGTMRTEQGAATSVWVSTAAAAAPPVLAPDPLPGLTWTGDGPYPVPVWTVPRPSEAGAALDEAAEADARSETARRRSGFAPADGDTGRATGEPRSPGGPESAAGAWPAREPRPADEPTSAGDQGPDDQSWAADDRAERQARAGEGRPDPRRPAVAKTQSAPDRRDCPAGNTWAPSAQTATTPQPRRPIAPDAEPGRGPRLVDVRRVPIDDATFYEFAGRLDALAREFAARATPGAPATELTIVLARPSGDGAGHGS